MHSDMFLNIYIYIYIHIFFWMFIYIYIYMVPVPRWFRPTMPAVILSFFPRQPVRFMPSCRHFVQSKFGLQLTNFLVKSIILYLNLLMDFHSFDQFFKKGSLILCQWCSGPGCTHRHGWGWRWRTWARAIITALIFGTFIWRHRAIIINGHLWWRHRAIIINRHLWWRQGKHWNRGHLWWRQGKHWNHTLGWGWRTRTPIFFALQPSHQCSIAVGGPSNILRKCTMVHSIAPDGVHLNLKLLLGDLCPVSMHSNNSTTNVLKDFSNIRRLRRCWFCWFASRHVAHKFQRDVLPLIDIGFHGKLHARRLRHGLALLPSKRWCRYCQWDNACNMHSECSHTKLSQEQPILTRRHGSTCMVWDYIVCEADMSTWKADEAN